MDNSTRSERSRKAAIQAALAIIARDGPGQLTFDAIARESGISKGGLMHQFPSKGALMKGLLEHQVEYFGKFSSDYLAAAGASKAEPSLAAQDAYVDFIRANAIDMTAFVAECTPSYFNNEGQEIVNAKGEKKFRSYTGEPYGPGFYAFETMLQDWREEGNLEGLELGN